nr:MAG TPA: Structural protein [Caudoviricetes sp.]
MADEFNYGTPQKGLNREAGRIEELRRQGFNVSYKRPAGTTFSQEIYRQNVEEPAIQEIGVVGLNDSMYDKDITSATQLDDLNNTRGELQPWYAQLGAGIGKGVVLAGTTAVAGTLGLMTGAVQAIAEGKWSPLWDNDVINFTQEINELSEGWMPNYRTNEEIQNDQNGEWYKNIWTANWWGDKFIKNLGFTAGAMATGSLTSGLLKGATPFLRTLVGSTISAINEGSIEANNNSKEWYEFEKVKVDDAYQQRLQAIDQNYKGTEMYNALMQDAKQTYEQSLAKLNEDRAKVGNVDLLLNIPILTASNWFLWGKLYSKGANTAIRDTKIAMKNGKYASTRMPIKAALGWNAEGAEEMEQKIAATIPGLKYGSEVENFYMSKWDPEAAKQSMGWIKAAAQATIDTIGDPSSWEEYTIGGLTAGIGMPMFRSAKSSEGKWRSPVTIEGGIVGEFRDYQEGKARDNEMINYLNSRIEDPNFQNYYQGLVRHNYYQNQMDAAAAEGDVAGFKDAESSQFISDVVMFDNAGKLNDLTEMINQAYDTSDENLDNIIKNTTDENGNGPFSTNGNAMDREDMIQSLTEDRDDILRKIKDYRTTKDKIIRVGSPDLTSEQVSELTWLNMKHGDYIERFNNVADDVREALKMNFATLEKEGKTMDRTILDLNNQELLAVLADPKNESFVAMQSAIRKILNDSYNIDKVDIEQSVKDLKKLAEKAVEFSNRFTDLLTHPEKMQEATAAADEQVANRAQEEQLAQVRGQLTNAQSFSDIADIVGENNVGDELLSENTNPLVKDFKKAMSFGAEMGKLINESELSDADKEALNALLDKRFKEEKSLADLTSPELITEPEGELSEEAANLFQNMIAEAATNAQEKDDIPDPLPTPQGRDTGKETTGSDATVTVPTEAKNPYTDLIGEVNNTVDKEYLDDFSLAPRIRTLETLVAKAASTKSEEDIRKASSELNSLIDDISGLPEMASEDNYNRVQKLIGTIASRIPQIPSASVTNEQELNYLDKDTESLPATTENRYYRPALSEYNTQKLAQGVFEPLIVSNPNYQGLYNFLQSKGAFDYVNNGNVHEGDVLTLKAERVGDYDEIVMYKGDQVVGTLPSLATAKSKNYVGLANLITRVGKGEQATLTVNKVMLGRFKYDRNQTQSVKDVVKGDVRLGVMKNMNLQTNGDINAEPVYDEVHSDGKVYLLLKNSRGTYSPKLVRVKHFNAEEFNLGQLSTSGNKSAQRIHAAIDKLSKISNPDQALTALNELGKVLHLDNTFHISLDNMGNNKVLTVRWLKDGEYVRKNILVERGGSGVMTLDPVQGMQYDEAVHSTPEEIYDGILNALYEYNPPFNISAGKVNTGTYNQDILNDDLLYTHLTDTQMTGSWFTTNYYDDAGTEQKAVNPKGRSFNPASGKEGVSVTVGGSRYYVENGNIYDINENLVTPSNAGLIRDLAYAESLYGTKTNGATMDRNRIVLPDGRVLNRSTQSYLSTSEADDVKRAIEGRKSKVAIINSTLQKLQEDQQKVKRNEDGTADTSSGSYMVMEEDGQYHEYTRVHNVIGSNWTGEFSANNAASMGNLVDDIARRFFGSNEKIEKPSNMSQPAFNALMKALKQMRVNLENAGEKLLTNRIVVFHKYEDGTRVAGELDALSVNELTGEFNIYDFKTSRYSFHPYKDKSGAVIDYFSSVGSRQTRSTRDQYTLQLSAYKNLFDSSYDGTINALALVPFVLNYTKDELQGVTAEKGIKLTYNPLVPVKAAQGVKIPETPPVVDKSNELLQPEVKQAPAPKNGLPDAVEGYVILNGQVTKGNIRPMIEVQGLPVYYYREPIVTRGLNQGETTLYKHYAVFNNGKMIQVVPGLQGEDTMSEEKAYNMIKDAISKNPARVVTESQDVTELSGKPIVVQKKNKLLEAMKDLQDVNQNNPEYTEGGIPKVAESPQENTVKPEPYDSLFNDSHRKFDDLDIETQELLELAGWSSDSWNDASVEERDKGLEQLGCF